MNTSFAFAGDQAVGQRVAQRLQEAGYALAAGLASADFIFTYCLAQSQLEEVYLGSGGAVEQAKEGCVLVDLSPSTCTLAKEVYAVARVNELQAVDAPLVFKDPCEHDALEAGNVLALAAGEDEAVADAMPLLQAIAGEVRLAGLPGAGQLAKALCTIQQASAIVALVEAHAVAQAQGGDGAAAVAAAVAARIAAPGAQAVYQAMASGHFHGTYSCRVLMSELTAVMNGAEEIDLVLPQAEACQHLLELFLVVGGADLAVPALALSYAGNDEGASYGLDWARAEGLYGSEGDGHHHHDDDFDYGFDSYDDDDDGFSGGFGGFSSN